MHNDAIHTFIFKCTLRNVFYSHAVATPAVSSSIQMCFYALALLNGIRSQAPLRVCLSCSGWADETSLELVHTSSCLLPVGTNITVEARTLPTPTFSLYSPLPPLILSVSVLLVSASQPECSSSQLSLLFQGTNVDLLHSGMEESWSALCIAVWSLPGSVHTPEQQKRMWWEKDGRGCWGGGKCFHGFSSRVLSALNTGPIECFKVCRH